LRASDVWRKGEGRGETKFGRTLSDRKKKEKHQPLFSPKRKN